ncbi:MAG: hypothetical protein SV062_02960 [Thermodesulfobacteriota bacterium]|nr:hypothetical protein [Thermodesulfobacteriota bacterium]
MKKIILPYLTLLTFITSILYAGALDFASTPDVEWSIRIGVKKGKEKDTYNFFGISTNASAKYDAKDLPKPPPISNEQLSLYFPHKDWGTNPDNYAADFRPPPGDKETFDFIVHTGIPESRGRLFWSNIREVPGKYRVMLIDVLSNDTVNMRLKKSYAFKSDEKGKREFKVVVVRKGNK